MSSESSGRYSINAELARQRQRLAAAAGHCQQLLARRALLEAQLKARGRRSVDVDLGKGISPDTAAVDELEAWNDRTSTALAKADQEMARLDQAERAAALRDELASLTGGRSITRIEQEAAAARAQRSARAEAARAEVKVTTTSEEVTHAAPVDMEQVLAIVERVVAHVPSGATEDERQSVDDVARAIPSSGDERVRTLIVELHARVQKIEHRVKAHHADVEVAEDLMRGFDGLKGPDVDGARALLEKVIHGADALVSRDKKRLEAIRLAAERRAEREFVVAQLAAAFESVGCEVEEGFATAVLAGRAGYIAERESDDHAIEVSVDAEGFAMRVVRAGGASDADADLAAQRSFCKALGTVSADLFDAGVELDAEVVPAGAPVVRVDAAQRVRTRVGADAEKRTRQVDR